MKRRKTEEKERKRPRADAESERERERADGQTDKERGRGNRRNCRKDSGAAQGQRSNSPLA